MKNIALLLVTLSLISCDKKVVPENTNQDNEQTNERISKKDATNGNEYIFYLKKENPVDSKNTYYDLDSIIIIKQNKRYVLDLLNKKYSLPKYEIINGIYANEDYNFDGINDIVLYPHRDHYSVYSVQYFADYFLFNKKNNCFEDNLQLGKTPNLEVCKKDQYLISDDGSPYLKKYQWSGDSLKLVEKVQEK